MLGRDIFNLLLLESISETGPGSVHPAAESHHPGFPPLLVAAELALFAPCEFLVMLCFVMS